MDLHQLVTSQRLHHESGATRSLDARLASIDQLTSALDRHEGELLDALESDLGKSAVEGFTTELQIVRGECRHLRRHLGSWMKPRRRRVPILAWPGRADVTRVPAGVVLILGPWNYPVQLLLTPLAGALAGGNCVVMKPSEFAPATAEVIARMIAGCLDPGLATVVQGGAGVAQALQQECFDHVFFTGSTSIGRKVMSTAAESLTPVTLELGGKCPALVFAADDRGRGRLRDSIDTIARRIAWGKFLNAGQTCVAPDHVLVDPALRDPLVEALGRAFTEFMRAGSGRMIHRAQFERVRGLMADGTLAFGGGFDEAALQIDPTILIDVAPDAAVMRDEIFGPVLPVLTCHDLADAISMVRSRPDPLAIYVFSHDDEVIERVTCGTRSGGVCVNDVILQMTGPDLPFGGIGESGMGRYRGRASFETFTRERVVMKRGFRPDLPFRYPDPAKTLAMLKKLPRFLTGG